MLLECSTCWQFLLAIIQLNRSRRNLIDTLLSFWHYVWLTCTLIRIIVQRGADPTTLMALTSCHRSNSRFSYRLASCSPLSSFCPNRRSLSCSCKCYSFHSHFFAMSNYLHNSTSFAQWVLVKPELQSAWVACSNPDWCVLRRCRVRSSKLD